MSSFKSGALLCLFLTSAAPVVAEEAPTLSLGESVPQAVAVDRLNGTSYATFGFIEDSKTSSVRISSGFIDYPSGVKCEWDTQVNGGNITFENTRCVQINPEASFWKNAPHKNMNQFGMIIRKDPVINFMPEVAVVERMGVFFRNGVAQTLERHWNLADETVCLKRAEGVNLSGGLFIEQDFGCFPVKGKNHLDNLLDYLGTTPA